MPEFYTMTALKENIPGEIRTHIYGSEAVALSFRLREHAEVDRKQVNYT